VLGGLAAVLTLVDINDRAGGEFIVRPTIRTEMRAPVAGFLKELYFDEGDQVSAGAIVARLEIPDLDSRLAQKQAEVNESLARLRVLEIGSRPEEVEEQVQRVGRAKAWRDRAQRDLELMQQALKEELASLDKQIAACQVEVEVSKDRYDRVRALVTDRALPAEEYHEAAGKYRVCQACLEQARAEKRARQTVGTVESETELARRVKELSEAESVLRLLMVGTRPEDIEAERAHLARVQEEAHYLEQTRERLPITAPESGTITTARLKERAGQYVHEGGLICVIEDPARLDVEISLAEEKVSRVEPSQAVQLKARALPFETFKTSVGRIAPAAGKGDVQSTLTVYCSLDNGSAKLKPGMTGYARVYIGRRPVGQILLDRILRVMRTEFWW
jgi:putative peptide zinc metalloprotease protein